MKNVPSFKQRHIVLLGASVGKAWNITELPIRINKTRYVFEYVGHYQFDKTPALDKLVKRIENKPDAIILKECAAYFPNDVTFEDSKMLMQKWIKMCKDNNIIPIPATVCPITRLKDEKYKTTSPLKRFVKSFLNISMMTCMDRIKEYNDWVKIYAKQNNLIVLDLEAPLIISKEERYLNEALAKPDGLHLNATAYDLLDKIVFPILNTINFCNHAHGMNK